MKLTTILKTGCTLAIVVLLTGSDCRDDGYYGYGDYVSGGGYGGFADPCYCDGGYYNGGYFEGGYVDTSYYYDDGGYYYDDDDKTKIAGKRKR